ncbi:hypothetical protein [Leptospira sp. GIMC2001]|uniref:hypothetical protein n=1 Tax=Leptospira sp. GIMC2001 TaxID=1513297 RepID=UPI00234A7ABB|nr:hypothetical protein [Leptospira sp. GIMC2001]WCL49724.1 hypothetical protein O4O04_02575 [Leptospira sp. GIMC2001]
MNFCNLMVSLRKISSFFFIISIFFIANCTPKDRPNDSFVIEAVLAGARSFSPEILSSRKINLNPSPELEVLYLIRNGTEEIIAVFEESKDNKESSWRLSWKKSFSLMNAGPMAYDKSKGKWIPASGSDLDSSSPGYIIRKILAEELAGDNFNSIFLEVMSEEPPNGIFTVPLGFREGRKILDGFSLLADHSVVKNKKRAEFTYNKENKSIILFPSESSQKLEFVWNGWEMIPNLSSQPIPSLISIQKTGIKYRLEFKNRGGYTAVTYLSFSFPQGGRIKAISETGLRAYKTGDSIFSKTANKYISATFPLLEATKDGWGANVRYAFEFEYEPLETSDADVKKNLEIEDIKSSKKENSDKFILFRTSYRYNKNIETIPNLYSVTNVYPDQQGFTAYKLELP